MSPLKCAVLWPLSTKAQFAGLPQGTLIVLIYPGGEKEEGTATDRSAERNMISITVISKNRESF